MGILDLKETSIKFPISLTHLLNMYLELNFNVSEEFILKSIALLREPG